MATAAALDPALISMEEYLHSIYHPDCDFVDGRLEERNAGEVKHSLLQAELAFWFRSHRDEDGGLKPVEADRLTVTGSPVYLDLAEIFGALDLTGYELRRN